MLQGEVFYPGSDILCDTDPKAEGILYMVANPLTFNNLAKNLGECGICLLKGNLLKKHPEIEDFMSLIDSIFICIEDHNFIPGYMFASSLDLPDVKIVPTVPEMFQKDTRDSRSILDQRAIDISNYERLKQACNEWVHRRHKGKNLLALREMVFWMLRRLIMEDKKEVCLHKSEILDLFNQVFPFHSLKRYDELGRSILYQMKIKSVISVKKTRVIDAVVLSRLGRARHNSYVFNPDRLAEIEREFGPMYTILSRIL